MYLYNGDSVCVFCAVYSHTEADVSSQCLLEANVSTEVCLTVLDTLSIFIMGFKVSAVTVVQTTTTQDILNLKITFWSLCLHVLLRLS